MKTMEKRVYVKPETRVFKITTAPICGSIPGRSAKTLDIDQKESSDEYVEPWRAY